MLNVTPSIQIPDNELSFSYARSSGPGGQNVNKVNSRAVLSWNVTTSPSISDELRSRFVTKLANRITKEGELRISSQRFRDQGRNAEDCLEKLADLLREAAVVPRKRRATQPTFGSQQKRLSGKKRLSDRKQNRRKPASE